MTGKAFLGQRRFVDIFFPSLNTVTETYRNKKTGFSFTKNLSAKQAPKEKFINGFHRNQSAAYMRALFMCL